MTVIRRFRGGCWRSWLRCLYLSGFVLAGPRLSKDRRQTRASREYARQQNVAREINSPIPEHHVRSYNVSWLAVRLSLTARRSQGNPLRSGGRALCSSHPAALHVQKKCCSSKSASSMFSVSATDLGK